MDDDQIANWADIILLEARLDAFETFFWKWLKNSEGDEKVLQFQKLFYSFCHLNVEGHLGALPIEPEMRDALRSFLEPHMKKFLALSYDI